MSNAQHTPGPWWIVPRKCLRGNTVGHEVRARNPNSHNGECILFVSPDSSVPTALPNARLISAAPDMLSALFECAAYFGSVETRSEWREECSALVNAAIAKATI